ncbi:MAG: alpha/beta fold hydrolase [Dehalococcoidales bacterium]
MKRAYIDTPEGQLHYRTGGSGEPLLLLHKVGLSSDQFTEMLPILGKYYLVIAVDILGCGNSDQPVYKFGLEDYARNTIHFLDAMKIKKTNIAGHLLGASLAVEIAAAYPDRVEKIVLCSCINLDPALYKRMQDEFRDKRMEFREDGSHLTDLWKSKYRMSRPPMSLENVQRTVVDYLRSGLGTRADDLHRALFEWEIEKRLPLIKSPTLLLYNSGDSELSGLEATKKLIHKCQTKILETTSSSPYWEKPEALSQAIIEFLMNP